MCTIKQQIGAVTAAFGLALAPALAFGQAQEGADPVPAGVGMTESVRERAPIPNTPAVPTDTTATVNTTASTVNPTLPPTVNSITAPVVHPGTALPSDSSRPGAALEPGNSINPSLEQAASPIGPNSADPGATLSSGSPSLEAPIHADPGQARGPIVAPIRERLDVPAAPYTAGPGRAYPYVQPGQTYSSGYVNPGYYGNQAPSYYYYTQPGVPYDTAPGQTYYMASPRRGLFGRFFGRGNRGPVPMAPSGYNRGALTFPRGSIHNYATHGYAPLPY